MIGWIRTSRLSVKKSLCLALSVALSQTLPSSRTQGAAEQEGDDAAEGGQKIALQVHLTQRIYYLHSESELPHKIVNLLFT